jgi:hydroxypyruvate isomerase
MKRRDFLCAGALLAGGAAVAPAGCAGAASAPTGPGRFGLIYAPHFGMFKNSAGNDPADQLQFAAEEGFTAWEDSGLRSRPVALQQRIADKMASLDMQMGAFVATASFQHITFARKDRNVWQQVLTDIRDSVEVARRLNARWLTVVPGHHDPALLWRRQTANCVELLRRCCDIVEPAGLVLVLEPLNARAHHPGCFLRNVPQAHQICRAVGSPSCKILFDLYHHQHEARLIANIDEAWSEIAYFQCGDSPGRKEPGTGRIDYRQVFRHLQRKGYRGVMGMEHGNSRPGAEGERAVIDAYLAADAAYT